MKISTKPTNLMLVGFLFICILFNPALAEQQLNGLGQLNKLKEHHHSDLGMLKVGAHIIYFAWSGRETLHVRPDRTASISTSTKKEEILMDSTNSTANVRDLSAINSLKQRDLLYQDSQDGGPSYPGTLNSQNIGVSGKGNDNYVGKVAKMEWQEDGISGRELENSDIHHAGNYLSVNVHDISVSAINTMQGGNAVATSNIIIEPVQIIVCPSEVDAKLK
jgi:hypothetical protein